MSAAYSNSKTRNVFVIIIMIALGTLMYVSGNKSKQKQEIKTVDRSGAVLMQNKRADSGDNPFIMDVTLVSESSNKLVFEVKYFMSEAAEGKYSISIHPDMSDWAQSMSTMHSGMNTTTITVSFKPQHPSRVKSVSSMMLIYVNHYDGNKYMGKVFERSVQFPKIWLI